MMGGRYDGRILLRCIYMIRGTCMRSAALMDQCELHADASAFP
jgi:hypothetical protein